MEKHLNVLDLFCGAGGLSCGFKQEGFNIILGIDHNQRAMETFLENHKDSKTLCGDITQMNSKTILDKIENKPIDVIIGGPPCQGFSMAGKRQPNDPRNSLFMEYLRMVKSLSPKIFLMENVKGLLSMKNEEGINVIDIILNEFNKLKDYEVSLYKVNTANFGVPQRRQRIFIIGVKGGINFSFPSPTHSREKDSGLKKWVGIESILLKKSQVPRKYFYSDKLIRGFKRREIQNKKRGVGFGWQINENLDIPSYTISARYWKDGAESLIKYNEKDIRMLTPQECAAVQSFPKSYIFKGSEKEVYTQIGNAVPPHMASIIAKSIKSALLS